MSDDEKIKGWPAEPPEDFSRMHRAIDRIDRSWVILGPMDAIVSNWKAWAMAVAVYGFFRGSEVVAFLDGLVGVAP